MPTKSHYGTNTFSRVLDPKSVSMPLISQGLDSVRTYQWEIHFELPTSVTDQTTVEKVVLAAKQVTATGFTSEAIEVHRVNDKVFYPGKASNDGVTVTFDNFYANNGKVSNLLWKWFQTTYDPMRGTFGSSANKTQKMTILNLGPTAAPQYETTLIGVWPKSWKSAEFNYGTNEFHTIEVQFAYDFMNHGDL